MNGFFLEGYKSDMKINEIKNIHTFKNNYILDLTIKDFKKHLL